MKNIKTFEDLIVWKKSKNLCILIYRNSESISDFSFKDQLRRASLSIMNNIAEGYGRNSPKQFRYFLSISRASCCEVKSMLHLANDLKYIETKEYERIFELSTEVSKILFALIKKSPKTDN